jgi:transcriptional regulator GlxA family with amidase domain
MSFTTGVLLFDDAEELDYVGPWEVFTMARMEGDKVVTIAEGSDPIRSAKGLRVIPDHTFADAPKLDVLVVPGGEGSRNEAQRPEVLEWVKSTAADCQWVTSVCTGAEVLHSAGLLAGRRATTHWAYIDRLRELGDATMLEDIRYVRDGNVVTAAGVSAGIDMGLTLAARIAGDDFAQAVQLGIEYDPQPPFDAGSVEKAPDNIVELLAGMYAGRV